MMVTVFYAIITWYTCVAGNFNIRFDLNVPADEKVFHLRFTDYKFFQNYAYIPRPKYRVTAVFERGIPIWTAKPYELVSKIELGSKKILPLFIVIHTIIDRTHSGCLEYYKKVDSGDHERNEYAIHHFIKVKSKWESLRDDEYSEIFFKMILSMEPEDITLDISERYKMERVCLADKFVADESMVEGCLEGLETGSTSTYNRDGESKGMLTIKYYPHIRYNVYSISEGNEPIWNSKYDDQVCTSLTVYEKYGKPVLVDLVAEDSSFVSIEYYIKINLEDIDQFPEGKLNDKGGIWKGVESDEYMQVLADMFQCYTAEDGPPQHVEEAPRHLVAEEEKDTVDIGVEDKKTEMRTLVNEYGIALFWGFLWLVGSMFWVGL